ncbi:MAG TPA: hypothetical protein VM935_02245 [Chitinophagaceae bacterium]|nr:hypothetical protein [Chitinophagaceae bacterium]
MKEEQKLNEYHLIECPRDAMQGWKKFIPTKDKIEYINSLLRVGFHTIDFGSFVSPKAIPQMSDTKEVVSNLDFGNSKTKLLAIVANARGAEEACQYEAITYLGFPFSISPVFQQRNTNSSMEESMQRIIAIRELCSIHKKEMVVYLSMAFGNPYGDAYNEDVLLHWAGEMARQEIKIISLADTVGLATPAQISFALQTISGNYPETEIGVHLHAAPHAWLEKTEAALTAGCTRFDGALKGFGGCPMADDRLVGNVAMEEMIRFFKEKDLINNLDGEALAHSLTLAGKIFVD